MTRLMYVPDTQVKPGVPIDHIEWIGAYAAEKTPEIMVVAGDWFDVPSLNTHAKPGSAELEGARFKDDIDVGNYAFGRFRKPIEEEKARRAKKANKLPEWDPQEEFTEGNHENRITRAVSADPKWRGTVSTKACDIGSFKWNPFLKRVWIKGVVFSHYFQNSHSSFPIGGNVENRLSKIGASFVQGHEQGKREGSRIMASGKTHYGLVAGSCYLHEEEYRGAQGQRHWRGIIMLHELEDGEYDIMTVSLKYLCRKYEGMRLHDYMRKKYKGDWSHLK